MGRAWSSGAASGVGVSRWREVRSWYRRRALASWWSWRAAHGREALVGDSPVVVCMTTPGQRLARAHISLESIGAGRVKPGRLILWVNEPPDNGPRFAALRRMQARGLELRLAPNFGPHTKYYPYVAEATAHHRPLATADDDVIYPQDWLELLLQGHRDRADLVHCHWARRLSFDRGALLPYLKWPDVQTTQPSPLHFALGVAGVIYPPALLDRLRATGAAFRECCPRADDVWLHASAWRAGMAVRQVRRQHLHPPMVPGTEASGLWHENHLPGGNDLQLLATYSTAELDTLSRAGEGLAGLRPDGPPAAAGQPAHRGR